MAHYNIKIDQLTKTFGKVKALDAASINFIPKTINGLIGPEGAGKTTLLRILTGLLRYDSGQIFYNTETGSTKFDDIKNEIAYMPQRQSLYSDLSVWEHLLFFKELYSLDEKKFKSKSDELLSITRLDKFVDRPAGKLSGGMYKKLGLMCSLLREPKILLLDEPTNGVDPISRREFLDLLSRLLETDTLIVITTAYMDEAEKCGNANLMQDGKVLAQGSPSKLLQDNDVHNITELFIKITKGAHQ